MEAALPNDKDKYDRMQFTTAEMKTETQKLVQGSILSAKHVQIIA